ncbi:hypothetical protein GQ457_07G001620 [Hibiscus cannabinus]
MKSATHICLCLDLIPSKIKIHMDEVKGKGERTRGQHVVVYVENISKAMSWQGLWFEFARHGNVVAAFISN